MAENTHSEASLLDDRERLKKHFAVATSEHPSRWNKCWESDFIPWDKGQPSPSLVDLLDSPTHSHLFSPKTSSRNKRALVPGCGRGYDVVLFAEKGYDAVGVEIAKLAADSAREYASGKEMKGSVHIAVGDFYQDEWRNEENESNGQWDVIYDYTFLCAMPLEVRPKWAARMNELLAPGGLLVCLEFPLYKELSLGGPPWGLTSEKYVELLGEEGQGLKRIAHVKPTRFHPISKGTDMITVWQKGERST